MLQNTFSTSCLCVNNCKIFLVKLSGNSIAEKDDTFYAHEHNMWLLNHYCQLLRYKLHVSLTILKREHTPIVETYFYFECCQYILCYYILIVIVIENGHMLWNIRNVFCCLKIILLNGAFILTISLALKENHHKVI